MVIPRIYADFNGYFVGDPMDQVALDAFGTLRDLHYFGVRLTEGLEIVAWDDSDGVEDMEVVGTCHYHSSARKPHWRVHFPRGSLTYVPRREETDHGRPFICFQCRQSLPDSCRAPDKLTCPHCGLSILFPWLGTE